MAAQAEVIHAGKIGLCRVCGIPGELAVIVAVTQVDVGIQHMLGSINDNASSVGADGTFKVACGAVCIVKSYAGYVMRPFGKFSGDRTDTIVVVADIFAVRSFKRLTATGIGGLSDGVAFYAAATDNFSGIVRVVAVSAVSGAGRIIKIIACQMLWILIWQVTVALPATAIG